MKCKYCGADYDSNLSVCPFCESENETKAAEYMQDELEQYDKEAESIKKKFSMGMAGKSGMLIFIGIVMVGILVFLYVLNADRLMQSKEATEDESAEYHKEQLEALLEKKDYEGMQEYFYEYDLFDDTYNKYSEIVDVYQNYHSFVWEVTWLEGMKEDFDMGTEQDRRYGICNALEYAYSCFQMAEKYSGDMVPRRNETYIEEITKQLMSELEQLSLDSESWEKLMEEERAWNHSEDEVIKPYIDQIYEHIFGQ